MTFRRYRLALVSILVLVLSGCGTTGVPGTTPPAAGGFVELAVSETCTEGSDPQCILVGDNYVMHPSVESRIVV